MISADVSRRGTFLRSSICSLSRGALRTRPVEPGPPYCLKLPGCQDPRFAERNASKWIEASANSSSGQCADLSSAVSEGMIPNCGGWLSLSGSFSIALLTERVEGCPR